MDVPETPMEIHLKRFQSLTPLILKGTEATVYCENWLDDIEILFDSLEYTDERKVKLIGHQLQEVAKHWWIATKEALEQRGTVITWKIFKAEFYRRFFPLSYRDDKKTEFETLKHGQLNIEEYVAKFYMLLRFAPHVAGNDESVADQFTNGLNPEIALNRAKEAEENLIQQRGKSYVDPVQK
ncbi:uncharacterized protein [Primulina eburnea]|uniref:uncharacterized protein n=1 Tax=Primulina eburnea TaxID=1245227 RepID=UPI003C6C05E6